MDEKQQIAAASNFILQSPPGQINDVLNDVRNIISNDDLLHDGLVPAIREYNLEQFVVVDVPGVEHQSILSDSARLPASSKSGQEGEEEETEQTGGERDETVGEEERFFDPRSKTSFAFNHITLKTTDPQAFEPDAVSEPFREALETAVLKYLSAHFLEGVCSVFATVGNPNLFTIQIVANKYSPGNYWSGRWRSQYVVDLDSNAVTGKVLLHVHYYEQGNVQLVTEHDALLNLPPAVVTSSPSSAASKIIALIEDEESRYQSSLNGAYTEMGEKTFKSLRRALPMTRQKIDWDKVLGYKLGAELASSKNMFGNS